jgi:hypothetical protein
MKKNAEKRESNSRERVERSIEANKSNNKMKRNK